MLTAKAKQTDDVRDPEIRAGNTRHVLDLIHAFGFSAGARIQMVEERDLLSQHVSDDADVVDGFDRDTLAGIWARGIRDKRGAA
jgi:hypothetical protein